MRLTGRCCVCILNCRQSCELSKFCPLQLSMDGRNATDGCQSSNVEQVVSFVVFSALDVCWKHTFGSSRSLSHLLMSFLLRRWRVFVSKRRVYILLLTDLLTYTCWSRRWISGIYYLWDHLTFTFVKLPRRTLRISQSTNYTHVKTVRWNEINSSLSVRLFSSIRPTRPNPTQYNKTKLTDCPTVTSFCA